MSVAAWRLYAPDRYLQFFIRLGLVKDNLKFSQPAPDNQQRNPFSPNFSI
jgi:hypothetical protein